jgi:hypothetical protein
MCRDQEGVWRSSTGALIVRDRKGINPARARRGAFNNNSRRRPKRSRTAPIAPSQPTPRPGPVDARTPGVGAAGAALVVTLVGAVAGARVVVGAAAAVVGVVAAVVVVAAGGVSPAKRIVPVAPSPAWSPYVSVQKSPAACWAAVGGHGYRAASAVGLVPALSVAGHVNRAGWGPHGGPTVPWTTLNVVDKVPVALVATSADNEIAVQLTETAVLTGAGRATVGCLASELHSKTFPGDVLVKPLPVIDTGVPLLKPVFGVMVMGIFGLAADADTVPTTMVSPPTASTTAAALSPFEMVRPRRYRPALALIPSAISACSDKKSPPWNRRAASTMLRSTTERSRPL